MKIKHLLTATVCFAVLGSQAALVGYWDFEDASTTTLLDQSGFGNTATVQSSGALQYSTDTPFASGASLSLDGTSGTSAQALDSASLSVVGNLTMVAWVKTAVGASGSLQIVSKNQGAYRWKMNNVNAANGNFNNGVWIAGVGDTAFTAGSGSTAANWMHLAVVFDDAANEKYYYKNGVLVNTFAVTVSLSDLSHNLQIGAHNTTEVFDGLMDDVAIYDQTLDATQISQLFDGSKTPITVIPEPATLGLVLASSFVLIASRRLMI